MTVTEIMKQAQALSPQERKELAMMLIESLDVERPEPKESGEHWGKNLNRLMDSLDMSNWENLDIDDPVEWVRQLRESERQRRLGA